MMIIKSVIQSIGILILCIVASTMGADQTNHSRPNIVWIMLEDWSPDMSCYSTKGIQTPHCDKLATQGTRYTRAFCTAPVCSSSRSAMMTGFHQNYIGGHQHRLYKNEKQPLPYGIKPMPLLLKEAGYYTAIMKSNKTDCNFQADLGFMAKDWNGRKPNQPFFAQITLQGTHRTWERDTIRPIAIEDIELPPYYADTPLCRRDWANGLEQMQICDREIGDIVQRLDDEGLTDNTLVFVIGDNGRCHIRGKQFMYEAGLATPLIVRWPGKIKPGQVSDDLVQTIDITATILAVAGVTPPHPLHGKVLWSDEVKQRAYIYAARGRMGSTHDAMRVIRSKRYKLIHNLMPERAWLQYSGYKEDNYPMLAEMNVLNLQGKLNADQSKFFAPTKPVYEFYDIEKDPHELNNLADDPSHQALMNDMLAKLHQWRIDIKDQGVTTEFRHGGSPSTYPTRSLEEWQERLDAWYPWVFRKPGEKVKHPFAPKH